MANIAGKTTEWVNFIPGGQRRIIADGDKLMLVEVKLDKGAVVAEHHHVHEQATYVVKGTARFTTPDGTVNLGAGQCIFLPSNVPHKVEFLEESVVVDSFSPPREDFR